MQYFILVLTLHVKQIICINGLWLSSFAVFSSQDALMLAGRVMAALTYFYSTYLRTSSSCACDHP